MYERKCGPRTCLLCSRLFLFTLGAILLKNEINRAERFGYVELHGYQLGNTGTYFFSRFRNRHTPIEPRGLAPKTYAR